MVENVVHWTMWYIVQELLGFPAMGRKFLFVLKITLVGYIGCVCCVSVLLKIATKNFTWFLYQHAITQRLSRRFGGLLCWSGNFCHFTATFDDFPSIWVILPESSRYSMYSIVAADPAVSCNKNRPSLMNFPIIWDFPEQTHIYVQKYLQLSWIFGILTEIWLKY